MSEVPKHVTREMEALGLTHSTPTNQPPDFGECLSYGQCGPLLWYKKCRPCQRRADWRDGAAWMREEAARALEGYSGVTEPADAMIDLGASEIRAIPIPGSTEDPK